MPTMGHALLALNFKKFIICIDLFHMTTVWKSENNLREWAPSFQPVGLRMKLDSQNSTLAP